MRADNGALEHLAEAQILGLSGPVDLPYWRSIKNSAPEIRLGRFSFCSSCVWAFRGQRELERVHSRIPTKPVPTMANTDWKRVVHEKRSQRELAIAEFKAILGREFIPAPLVDDIDDIGILASKISKGALTSEEVTKACIARYLLISVSCPCLRNCNLTANLGPSKLTKR